MSDLEKKKIQDYIRLKTDPDDTITMNLNNGDNIHFESEPTFIPGTTIRRNKQLGIMALTDN